MHRVSYLLLWSFLFLSWPGRCQEGLFHSQTGKPASPQTLESYRQEKTDLFAQENPLQVILESDFDEFSENRWDGEYQTALLVTRVSDSLETRHQVRIRPRGKSRRRMCDLPPIQLNLKKANLINEDLRTLEKLKLVSPCKKGDNYEKVLFKEFLVYKLLNVLTPNSFRVRLIEMTLRNKGKKQWERMQYGFVIEEGDAVGERLGMEYQNSFSFLPHMVNQDHYALVALFQFMIGNPDWSLNGAQNLKTFRRGNEDPINTFIIPYDFDVASIVEAPYAVPPAEGFSRVQDRRWLATCLDIPMLENTFRDMLQQRKQLVATLTDFPYLPDVQKRRMIKYLDTFFDQLQKPSTWPKIDIPPCKNP